MAYWTPLLSSPVAAEPATAQEGRVGFKISNSEPQNFTSHILLFFHPFLSQFLGASRNFLRAELSSSLARRQDSVARHVVAADPPGGISTDPDPATFRSVLGVGERLSIHIDAMREEAAPGVAAGKGSAGSASAIQIMIRHLGPAVDVGSSAVPPSGDRSRLSSPINGRRGAFSRSDSESSSSSGEDGDQTRRKKKLRAEMQGVFEILVLVMAVVVPISLMVYTLLPDGNPSAHRNAWVALGIVVSLATIGAIIARLAATEAAAEVSSAIGVVASIVLIIISEIVLVEVLPYEFWSRFWGSTISACLLIGTIYAWTECAQRPKFLRSCIRGSPSCIHSCMMGIIGFCDKWLL